MSNDRDEGASLGLLVHPHNPLTAIPMLSQGVFPPTSAASLPLPAEWAKALEVCFDSSYFLNIHGQIWVRTGALAFGKGMCAYLCVLGRVAG